MTKLNKKILIGTSLSLVGIVGISGIILGVLSATSNKNINNNVVDSSLQPKFLGMNDYGINEYVFNNKPISYNGYYYENSAEAVKAYITQDTNSKNKIITGNEAYIGDYALTEVANGDAYKVNMDGLNSTFFKKDASIEDRLVPIYENYRLNGSGVSDSQRFTTSREQAKMQSISNWDTGEKYTDGFGNIFSSETNALNSRKNIIGQQNTTGMGFYEVVDYSTVNPTTYMINPFNKDDQNLLKTIAINNLNIPNGNFEFDIFNTAKDENNNLYLVSTNDGYGSVYQSSSQQIANKAKLLLSNFIEKNVLNKIKYTVNVDPAYKNSFNIVTERRHAFGWTGLEYATSKVYINNESLGKSYSPDPSSNSNTGFVVKIGGQESYDFEANDLNTLEDIVNTYTDRSEFGKKYNISVKEYDMFDWNLHGSSDPFNEFAESKTENLFGKKAPSITFEWDIPKTYKYGGGWMGGGPRDYIPGHFYNNDAIDFGILKDYGTVASWEGNNEPANSELIFNLTIKPSISITNTEINTLSTNFENEILSDPLISNAVANDQNLSNFIKSIFNKLSTYISTHVNGQNFYTSKTTPGDYSKLQPTNGLNGNYFSNSSSWVSDFIEWSDFNSLFKTNVIENGIYNIQQNVIDSKTAFIIKYNGAPLYQFNYDPDGIVDNNGTPNDTADDITLKIDDIFGTSSLAEGKYYDVDAVVSSLQRALTNPAYIRKDGQNVVLKNLINISNKTKLAQFQTTANQNIIQKYVIPAVNIDNISTNDINYINFDQNDTREFKKIKIPEQYTENNSNENYNISGHLLISKQDPLSMLNRNSGIYMIANYYNKQVDSFYQKFGGNINNQEYKDASKNFIKNINDVVILYNSYSNTEDGTELNDYLNVSRYGEVFIPSTNFNISLNKDNQRMFSYSDDKDEFIRKVSSSDENAIGTVYIYNDYNNKQLNKNIYNSEELAKQEAYNNIVIRPSQEKVLLLNEGVTASDKSENYVDQGIVISKNTSMLTWIDLSNLANRDNGWSSTPIYFTNYTNAFNYMRYLFEMSYTYEKK